MTIDPFDLTQAAYGEPPHIVIGTSHQWRRVVNVDPTGLTMAYVLVPIAGGADAGTIEIANITGADWGVDIEPGDIANIDAGDYRWRLVVSRTSDGRSRTIDNGYITVFAVDADRRSHAQQMIAKIESLLLGRADNDIDNYSIKSRSLTKMSVDELTKWRDYYRRELDAEAFADRGLFSAPVANPNTLRVRFTD